MKIALEAIEKVRIAEAFLKRLKGYQEAVDIMHNRCLFYGSCHDNKKGGIVQGLLEMDREAKRIRGEIFGSLADLEDQHGNVLWGIYIEGKEPDEVADWLGITLAEVERSRDIGLYRLEIPAETYQRIKTQFGGKENE